jgi:hypothetical protein
MTLIERLAVGTMAPLRVVWVEARQTAVLVVRLSEEVFAADLSRRPLALESIVLQKQILLALGQHLLWSQLENFWN